MFKNGNFKVSIIVPILNSEKYLNDCLNSLISQTLTEIEIICADGGSDDNSIKIIEKFANKDPRIKIITQPKNDSDNIKNIGLQAASGEFVGFVNPKDKADLDFFSKLYNTAKKYNADIACAGIIKFDNKKEKKIIHYKKCITVEKVSSKYELAYIPQYSCIWNKIYKTKLLSKYRILFEENTGFEEVKFIHKALLFLKRMVTVPNIYYNSRNLELPDSISLDEIYKTEFLNSMENAHKLIEEYNINWKYDYKYPSRRIWSFSLFRINLILIKKIGRDYLVKILGIPFFGIKNHL